MSDINSQDVAKQAKQQVSNVAGSVARNKHARKLAGKALKIFAKLAKQLIAKIGAAALKSILLYIGPMFIVIILAIVLVLAAIDSIITFDWFSKGENRGKAEYYFDETISTVLKDRTLALTKDFPAEMNYSGGEDSVPADFTTTDASWADRFAEELAPTWTVPAVLLHYSEAKSKNKPWHEKYKGKKLTDGLKKKIYDEIYSAYDYYFEHESMKPEYTYGETSGEEVSIKSVKVCRPKAVSSSEAAYQGAPGGVAQAPVGEETTSETVTKEELKGRKILTNVNLLYLNAEIPYAKKSTEWVKTSTTSQTDSKNDCSTTTYKKYTLQLVDDSQPAQVQVDAKRFIEFLTLNNPDGDKAMLVNVKDLEYIMELIYRLEPKFPKLIIDYGELTKCFNQEKDAAVCIGLNVSGGGFVGGFELAGWYPEALMELYKKAGEAFNVDWWILAAIHGTETTFSANPAATDPNKGSSVGAKGHMQFMPRTWIGWNFKGDGDNKVTGAGNIVGPLDITDISIISKYGGYGVDGNGNGKASPWEIEDAMFTAAKYLSANGYKIDNEAAIKKAIGAYNHSSVYINEVFTLGLTFKSGKQEADISIAEGTFTHPTTGKVTSGFGPRNVKGASKNHKGIDVGLGGRQKVPIVSVADGKVTRSAYSDTYGEVVYIQHNVDGQVYETVYAHLTNRFVKNGESISKGKLLGYMGNTGRSLGAHLHFEFHVGTWNDKKTNAVNPLLYIKIPPK